MSVAAGCVTAALAHHGSIIGIDVVAAGIEVGRGLYPELDLRHATIRDLIDRDDARFAGVVSTEVIEHVPRAEHREFVADISAALEQGGWLLLTTPRAELQPRWRSKVTEEQPLENWLTERQLDRLLEDSGFVTIERTRAGVYPLTWWQVPLVIAGACDQPQAATAAKVDRSRRCVSGRSRPSGSRRRHRRRGRLGPTPRAVPVTTSRYLDGVREPGRSLVRGPLGLAFTAVFVGVVFVLTDHRRDLVGVTAGDGGPTLITTVARLALLGFAAMLVLRGPGRLRVANAPLVIAVGVFALYLGLSAAWSPDSAFTVRKLAVIATVGLTAFCIGQALDLKRITDLILVVFVGYLVLGAGYEIASGSVRFLATYRFTGTTSAAQNGLFAAVVALISAARLYSGAEPRATRAGYWLLLAVSALVTAVSFSRTSMVGLGAAALVAAAVAAGAERSSVRLRIGVALSAAGLAGVVTMAILGNHRSANLGSFGYRSDIWEQMWAAVQDRPIAGYGYRGYWARGSDNRVVDPHSTYLDFLLDGGAIGLVLALLILVLALRSLVPASRRSDGSDALFGVLFVCFAMVHGLAESYFGRPTIGLFFLSCVVAHAAAGPPCGKDRDSPTSPATPRTQCSACRTDADGAN